MNTTTNAVTGESKASRIIVEGENAQPPFNPTKTIWNSDGSEPCLICAPSFEDIARMAGVPFDDTIEAVEAELDERDRTDDDTRTLGLTSDESDDEDDAGSVSEAWGESDAERNA